MPTIDKGDKLYSRFKNIWLLIISGIILFISLTFVMPQFAQKGGVNTAPDLHIFYTPQQVYDMVALYPADNRMESIRKYLIYDTIYPLSYTFFLFSVIAYLIAFTDLSRNRTVRILRYFPAILFLFDMVENAMVFRLHSIYPVFSYNIGAVAGAATSSKWTISAVVIIFLLFLLVKAGLKLVQNKKATA
jgi:uncharacterized integral membrane protein